MRIGIVGGGPSGSFFAILAQKISSSLGFPLEITIFERKDFLKAGPAGCNMCAGIISASTFKSIGNLGIRIPDDVIMARIDRYILHFPGINVEMKRPEGKGEILSIYRGGGPLKGDMRSKAFDHFLISEAISRGASLIKGTVKEIELTSSAAYIRTTDGDWRFDLVVYAGGVNGEIPEIKGHRYVPPKTERMVQDEFLNPFFACSSNPYNSSVHVFFKGVEGLIFAGFVPKGPYMNLSILGHGIDRKGMDRFLEIEGIDELLRDKGRLCGCQPKVVISISEGFYGDRFVAIGDACVSRLYKDGIGSALMTATRAAETALLHGIMAKDFEAHYLPLCKGIDRDNAYGKRIFKNWKIIKDRSFLTRAGIRILEEESRMPWEDRKLERIIWGMLTGEGSYEVLYKLFMNKGFQKSFWRKVVLEIIRPSHLSGTMVLGG